MCRLFGFRSVMQSQVHRSLVSADNALIRQSEAHPDGWGVAYFLAGAPHVIKSADAAVSDQLFRHVSGIVTSETVLAHVRRATQGEHTIVNTHPFQYGHWVMVHNGNIREFERARDALSSRVDPALRRFILGTTDSEVLFYLVLTKMAARVAIETHEYPIEVLAQSVREAVADVEALVGPACDDADAGADNTFLTFVLTNGRSMIAYHGGKELHLSTYKQNCPERDSCPYYAPQCESAQASGFVSHFIVSSEPMQGANVWEALAPRDLVAVDGRMRMQRFST
jgi:glutamine amidotransferase